MKSFKQIFLKLKEEKNVVEKHSQLLYNHLASLDKVKGSDERSEWRHGWDNLVKNAANELNHGQLSDLADRYNAVTPQRETGEPNLYDQLAHTHEQLRLNLHRVGLKEVLDHSRAEQMKKLPIGFQGPY